MTITNENNNLNTYLYSHLKRDLVKIQTDVLAETSKTEEAKISEQTSTKNSPEIKDEFITSSPDIKPKVEVTLEERMNQVISPEEVKILLSLLMKTSRIASTPAQLVDIKG